LRRAGPNAYAELSGLVSDFGDGPGGGTTTQLRVFGAVLRLLDKLGADRPVIMVIEDIHWADPSTVDLVDYLARGQTTEKALLVCTYRSSDLRPGDPVRRMLAELDRARKIHRIDLSRFTPEELAVFLTVTTGEPPSSETIDRCVELSDGNAFFVEELLASGLLLPGSNPLPPSLRDVVLARVELLGDDERDVLRAAAVAGRRVSHRLLAAVSELPERVLTSALRECVAQHMLVIDPGDDTYVFRHALLREAVYQDLLPGERLALHAAIARALDADPGMSYAEDMTVAAELAYHWTQAREYPAALAEAVRAGHAAMRIRAFRDAERQYQRALDLWPRVPDAATVAGTGRVPLLAAAADAARWSGHVKLAVEHIRAAVADTDDAELYERLGSYLWEAGDSAGSRAAYETAAGLLAGAPPTVVLARVLAGQASVHLAEGRHSVGLAVAEEAVSVARAFGEAAAEGRALSTAGVAHTLLGRTDVGIETMREAVRITETVDNLEDRLRAYANLAYVLAVAGRPDESLHAAETGYGIADGFGLGTTRMGGRLANNIAASLVQLGRWDEAAARLTQLLIDRPVAETRFPTLTLAEIHLARGRFDHTERLVAAVGRVEGSATNPELAGPMAAYLAEIHLWCGSPMAARQAVADGLAVTRDAENAEPVLRLCALGLRAEADEHDRLRAVPRQRSTATDPVRRRAAELIATVENLGTDLLPENGAIRRQCVAEYARIDAPQEAARLWRETADGWEALRRPYPAAYARWRLAEAAMNARDVHSAATAARAAYQGALRLVAVPLRDEILSFSRRSRIDLADTVAAQTDKPAPPTAHGLTPRELDVLRRLCDGHTNRQIASELFITEKTVGAHVSNILMKLDVNNRGEAAAAAHRLRLFT
jgi:DNA-binding CsgD family transcriptional regulator/tetratricopeptide (TPR) repeat protein